MTDSNKAPVASRRHALKLLGAAPMLPLGGLAFLTACGGGGDGGQAFPPIVLPPAPPPAPAANFVSAEFTSMAAPSLANAAAMATTTVGSTLKVSFDNGSSTEYKLAYQPFFLTGDMVSDGKGGKILAGGYVDINNKPIIDASVVGKERQFFSDAPDGSSLLSVPNASVPGVKGKPVFAVVQIGRAHV